MSVQHCVECFSQKTSFPDTAFVAHKRSCYLYRKDKLGTYYNVSQNFCNNRGATLAIVNDDDEFKFMSDLVVITGNDLWVKKNLTLI